MSTLTELQRELDGVKADKDSHAPRSVIEQQGALTEALRDRGVGKDALGVGDPIPMFSLPDQVGAQIRVEDFLKMGSVVISFFRGEWCPYCQTELGALHIALPEIHARNARLLAISPQTLDHTMSTAERLLLEFSVLSDLGNDVAKQFGLAFDIPDEFRAFHDETSARISDYNGDESYVLPVPATYVVDPAGTIRYAYADVDPSRRAEPADVMSALEEISS